MDRVQGNVVYDNGLVRIDDAQLSIGAGNAKVKGQYVVDTGDFDAIANVHALSLDTFTQDLTMPITGTVDGEVRVLGKNNQLTDLVGAIEGRIRLGSVV
ncbi:MAG: hypothetical protein ACLUPK_01435 [Veillonella sp.]